MFGQQITGQAFVSQYSVIFYQQEGFGAQAFWFTVLNNAVSLVCLLITWSFVDALGRRYVATA
jgi:MFS transporter, SP family, sugar:H+ symporter